jgi:serine/threonine protein kinase
MQSDDRLLGLLDRWLAERDAGRTLSAAELCRDNPDLLAEVERQIAVLGQSHAVYHPAGSSDGSADAADGLPTQRFNIPSPESPPGPGTQFGRYRITAELGHGGMGVVYVARDTQLDRDVALKIVRPDRPVTTDRFLREARAMAAVRHDHVVEIYDYGEENGVRFVAMPLLTGETLAARLDRKAPLPVAEVLRIGRELADGLAAVHDKGLIHRDLKPANIWLEAPQGRVKLLDFGLARDSRAEDRVTRPGTVVGTPAYMSPEQVNGLDLDARSDLFSLGSVLYMAATGQPAFSGATHTAVLHAVGENYPPPARTINPALPSDLSNLIERLHQKQAADRPASAAEVAKELARLAADLGTPTTDWRGSRSQRRRWPGGSNRARMAGAGMLLLIVGALLAYTVMNRPRDAGPGEPPPSTAAAEPIRIRALDILHFEGIDANRVRPRGVLGKESFGATAADEIKATARLSGPAYCYLIVFRPDGKDEILYPQGADRAPERTGEPRYPSRDRNKVYGLTDGTGLWLVALVASERELPAYAQWRRQHPGGPWARSDGEPNVVWFDDGDWLEEMTPRGLRSRGARGEKDAAGTAPIVRVVDWLKAETGGTVSAVAFTVEAKK